MLTRTIRLSLAAFLMTIGSAAHAKVFIGQSADITDFANGSEVSTRGTLVDAVKLLNQNVGGVGVGTTINGVPFQETHPGGFFEGTDSFENASFVYHGGEGYSDDNLWTSGGAYDTLADSQIFNMDNQNSNNGDGYGVINLVPNQVYELQVFMLDDRAGVNKTFPLQFQQVHFTGNFDQFDLVAESDLGYIDNVTIGGNGVLQANGEIATVVFALDSAYNGIFVNSWNGGAFNGMQLRQLPGLPGDLDFDNQVDGDDFLLWQRGLGSAYTDADLADITRYYGASLNESALVAVPEPTTAGLFVAAGAALMSAARRRRCRHSSLAS